MKALPLGACSAITRLLYAWIVVMAIFLIGAHQAGAQAADAAAPPPEQVRELVKLLDDPAVKAWLQDRQTTPAPAPNVESRLSRVITARISAVGDHLSGLVANVTQLPVELQRAGSILRSDFGERGIIEIVLLLAVFIALGFVAEWLFRRATQGLRERSAARPLDTVRDRLRAVAVRLTLALGNVLAFAAGSVAAFLMLRWPLLLKEVVLDYLLAFLGFRIAIAIAGLLLSPGNERVRMVPIPTGAAAFWYSRVGVLAAWFAFGLGTVQLLDILEFNLPSRELAAYLLGLGLLALGLELIWRRPESAISEEAAMGKRRLEPGARKALLSLYLVILWVLWVASAMPLFWFLVVVVGLPAVTGLVQRIVNHVLTPPGSASELPGVAAVCVERGIRALLVAAAVLLLARAWQVDLLALTSDRSDALGRLVRGALISVVIVLVADFGWQLSKALIDAKLSASSMDETVPEEVRRRRHRLLTLLPILRNVMFVVLLVMTALMVLASLGVAIGPLIAGAGVVGVAIGFGAQTLVKDVISGMFYLLDDAFRVGEFIVSGSHQGTVESFSIRSIKLRDPRGALNTVPFGELGAVQNMSRDWAIDKFNIGITYDSDIELARKLIKQIGQDLAKDPEFGSKILEPLKMQGVNEFGDFAVNIRLKIMTKPGEQTTIRRKAYAMIKKAFDANGIKFAFPTVQIAGADATPALAAAAQRVLHIGEAPADVQPEA